MQERDAYALLTLAAARDNRAVSPEVAKVWADDLGDVTPGEAVEVMRAHYREKPDVWLLPGHIVQGVAELRRERARVEREWDARTWEIHRAHELARREREAIEAGNTPQGKAAVDAVAKQMTKEVNE